MKKFNLNSVNFNKKCATVWKNENGKVGPRKFRLLVGVNKKTLHTWKISDNLESQKKYEILMDYQDKILGEVEHNVIYGNQKNIGGIFVLKSYETFYRESTNFEFAPLVINIPKIKESERKIKQYARKK